MGALSGRAAATASGAGPGVEYLGYEALLDLPDKERAGSAAMGWDARRVRRWLGRLGDPQSRLRCTVVAGSKGKGSTAALLESILRRAGRRTGLYTQPHLHRYAERIRIDGRPLPAAAARAGLRAVLRAAPVPATAFETATVFCLWAFARAGVDEAVLEVGFGGRLDAVAECDPAMVLLTPLEREHTDLFGPTLAEVAAAECSLCRYGRVCLSAPQPPEVRPLFEGTLRAHGADGGWAAAAAADGAFVLPDGGRLYARVGLPGPFQRDNAALAVAAAATLGAPPAAIAEGLAAARWAGRWERVARRPEVVVDGAHTPLSARAVAEALAERRRGRRAMLVVGMLADKDAAGVADAFAASGLDGVWATEPEHPRAMPATDVAAKFRLRCPAPVAVVPAVRNALAAACGAAGPRGLVVAAGSLRLVAEARAHFGRTRA